MVHLRLKKKSQGSTIGLLFKELGNNVFRCHFEKAVLVLLYRYPTLSAQPQAGERGRGGRGRGGQKEGRDRRGASGFGENGERVQGQIMSRDCCLRQKARKASSAFVFLLGHQVKHFALHCFLVMLTTSMVERAWNVERSVPQHWRKNLCLPCACVIP